jgi:protein-S-isoprenylcysteine O-methyltransferase Ste14/SAM-dependent methyltransferase
MIEALRIYFVAFYAVRLAVFLFRVLPGNFRNRPVEHQTQGLRGWLPAVLIPLDSLLPPLLILFRTGELQVFWLPLRWLGVLFSVAAGAVSLWAVHTLGRSFMPKTVVVPDQVLVTSGPYRVVRHPAYFGDLALWLGAGLGMGNWLLLGLWPLALLGLHWQAREEEELLALKFGDTFKNYVSRTWELFPWIPRARRGDQWSPSASNDWRAAARRAKDLYTHRLDAYLTFNAVFRYPQCLGAFFKSCDLLRPGLRILDAGCGTGTATFALLEAQRLNQSFFKSIDGFDLTPAMLSRFQERLKALNVTKVRLREANVLELQGLPTDWANYDLVISAAMLEYVPRAELMKALAALRVRLAPDGCLLLFVSRRIWITRILIERCWKANRYTRKELEAALHTAGFTTVKFQKFPSPYFWQNWWGHVVAARSANNTAFAARATAIPRGTL